MFSKDCMVANTDTVDMGGYLLYRGAWKAIAYRVQPN